MALVCSNCGMENADTAAVCRRCRVPFEIEAAPEAVHGEHAAHEEVAAHAHGELPAAHAEEPAAPSAGDNDLSGSLGEVCRRCESYNEPGARKCSNCGASLVDDGEAPAAKEAVHGDPGGEDRTPEAGFRRSAIEHAEQERGLGAHGHDEAPAAHGEHAPADDRTPPEGMPSLSDELATLALSDEDARDALGPQPELAVDATPREGLAPVAVEAHDTPVEVETWDTPIEPPRRSPGAAAAALAGAAALGAAAFGAAAAAGASRRGAAPPRPEPAAEPKRAAPPAAAAPEPKKAAPPPPAPEAKKAPPPPAAPEVKKAAPPPAPELIAQDKTCPSCAAVNPPAAKFCSECGTPFRKAAPPPAAAAAPPGPAATPAPAAQPTPAPAVAAPPRPGRAAEPPPRAPLMEKTDPGSVHAGDLPHEEPPAEPAHFVAPVYEEPLHDAHDGAAAHSEDEAMRTAEQPPLILHDEPAHEAPAQAEPAYDEHAVAEHAHDEQAHAEHADEQAHAEPTHDEQAHAEAAPVSEPSVAYENDDAPVPVEDDPLAQEVTGRSRLEAGAAATGITAEDDAPTLFAGAVAVEHVEDSPVEVAEDLGAADALPEDATPPPLEAVDDAADAAEIAEPIAEPEPPYQATLIVERGSAAGTAYMLGHIENPLGAEGPLAIEGDPYLAPRQATLLFDDQRLLLRDEGAVNGVFVRVREWAPLEPGDQFIAGERLLRFDGPGPLPDPQEGETPFLGAPRPVGGVLRVTEVLAGGRSGRVCLRAGPVIAVGKAGCDLNFPADAQLGPRHAEIRIADDGTATLHDLAAAPSGVFVRLREHASHELQAGDSLLLGDQLLRLEI